MDGLRNLLEGANCLSNEKRMGLHGRQCLVNFKNRRNDFWGARLNLGIQGLGRVGWGQGEDKGREIGMEIFFHPQCTPKGDASPPPVGQALSLLAGSLDSQLMQ